MGCAMRWIRRARAVWLPLLAVGIVLACGAMLRLEDPYPHPRYRGAGHREPQRGGTLRLSTAFDLGTLDPHNAGEVITGTVHTMLFDTLVYYAPGTAEPRGGLAKSWQVSGDGRVYTFRLRSGVRFHNGHPFTARDVKRSFERMLDPERAAWWGASYFDGLEGREAFRAHRARELLGVVVRDPLTVEFRLVDTDAAFPGRLSIAPIVPVDVVDALGSARFGQEPVGTGPFVIDSWEPGTRIVLRRNPNYFLPGLPRVDRVVFDLNVPVHIATMRFQRGDVDLLINYMNGFSTADVAWFAEHPAWRSSLVSTPVLSTNGLVMNTELPPWNDVHVRRALAFALDREELERSLPGQVMRVGGPFMPGLPGYDPRLPNAQRLDLARARHELGLAGFPHGLPDEQDLWFSGDPTYCLLIQAQLARIGIRIRLRPVDTAVLGTNTARRRAVGLSLFGWVLDFPDPISLLEPLFHSRGIAEEGATNSAFYSNLELDRLLDRARLEPDPDRRTDLYRQAERIIVDDAPWAFTCYAVNLVMVQSYVREFRAPLAGYIDLRNVWLDTPTRQWEAP